MVIQSSNEAFTTGHGPFSLEVGMRAPDFVLDQSDGSAVALADLRGQPVILAFYPSSWDPTRAEGLLHFNELVSRVPGANAELLGISADGMWCKLAFADADVSVPLLADRDPYGDVAARYGVAGQQALFVIDSNGIVRWRHVAAGGGAPHPEDLVAALTKLSGVDGAAVIDAAAETDSPSLTSRRDFLTTALAASLALTILPRVNRAQTVAGKFSSSLRGGAAPIPVTLRVNGRAISLDIEPRVTLLDALREYAGLTGSKKGCDHGQCGACTVHVNGRRTLSCLSFAAMHQQDEVTTVEGLANGDALHPMQAAFIEHDGFQCGYCTPGQLMSATALLKEPCGTADADVRECMSGNICRCGAYPGIVAAFQSARARG